MTAEEAGIPTTPIEFPAFDALVQPPLRYKEYYFAPDQSDLLLIKVDYSSFGLKTTIRHYHRHFTR